MQKVTVPYGEGSLSFPVDDGIEITRLELLTKDLQMFE